MNIFIEYKNDPKFKSSYRAYFKYLEAVAERLNNQADFCCQPNPHSAISNHKSKIPPIPSLFHPVIISTETLQKLKNQAEQMSVILQKCVQLYLNNKEVRDFLNFPEILHEWITIEPGYSNPIPISRYDGFWNGTLFKFCEVNTDGTSGMAEINTLDEAFFATELGRKLKQKYNLRNFDLRKTVLDTLIKCYRDFGGKKEKPNIAIVDFLELATISEFIALKNYFATNGYPTEICDVRKLDLKKDGLYHNNFKIDLIYRRAVTDDMLPGKDNIKTFIKAYREHATCVVGPLRSHIAHTKLLMTFLTSPIAEKYFSDKEMKFIRSHIPWTRKLTNDPELIERIILDKDDYFLKPHNSNSGKGVYTGAEAGKDSFRKIISQIIENKNQYYLVQKKIPISTDYFISDMHRTLKKYNINIASYILDNKLSGFFSRVSQFNIINTDRGALALPSFLTAL